MLSISYPNFGDIMVTSIFKDFDDESHHYFIAKDIAEHIDLAIDEIKALKGYNEVTNIEVIFNEDDTEIIVNFRNSNDKIYCWSFRNQYKMQYKDSIAKMLYFWYNKWMYNIQNEFGNCVGFYFNY